MATHYLFSHLCGCCVLDEQGRPLAVEAAGKENDLISKFSNLVRVVSRKDPHLVRAGFEALEAQMERETLRTQNVRLTRQSIKESVTPSTKVVQAVKAVDDTDRVINTLSKRLRDWYDLHAPEVTESVEENHELAKKVAGSPQHDKGSFGADFAAEDLEAVQGLAGQILSLLSERAHLEAYISRTLEKEARNLSEVATPLIAARLLAQAGSLKQLAMLPSSTVQVLGAEKALFRHLVSGSKPPKYGVLFAHEIVQHAPRKKQGKAARLLADKIALAAKLDLFKGEYQGEKMLEDVWRRLR